MGLYLTPCCTLSVPQSAQGSGYNTNTVWRFDFRVLCWKPGHEEALGPAGAASLSQTSSGRIHQDLSQGSQLTFWTPALPTYSVIWTQLYSLAYLAVSFILLLCWGSFPLFLCLISAHLPLVLRPSHYVLVLWPQHNIVQQLLLRNLKNPDKNI